jgi:hypothetical protein
MLRFAARPPRLNVEPIVGTPDNDLETAGANKLRQPGPEGVRKKHK